MGKSSTGSALLSFWLQAQTHSIASCLQHLVVMGRGGGGGGVRASAWYMGAVGPGMGVYSAGLAGQEVLEPWTPSKTVPHSSSDPEHPFRLHPNVLSFR